MIHGIYLYGFLSTYIMLMDKGSSDTHPTIDDI